MNKKLQEILEKEYDRQRTTLGLIPSENFPSKAVREAVGSVAMNKYSEGYPGARYYEGNENIDDLENLCREMVVKIMLSQEDDKLKEDWHANVQVLSGSVANLAVYNSILKPGDKIMSMYLPDGGHLSHGWSYSSTKGNIEESGISYYGGDKKVNFTSKLFDAVQYKTNPETYLFDYDAIEKLAVKEKPKLIITGGTAYPRDIYYKRMREIADKVGAIYHADVAHEAGLIAGGAVPSPFKYADFVTFTTHKTLRGPKGAVAMCRKKYAKKLDRSVFPGLQGGPFNHTIAGITQALFEADTEEFRDYAAQVVANAKTFASELLKYDFDVLTEGTDKHLILVRLDNKDLNGKFLARALAHAGIVANMNTVPYEKGSPKRPSGIRFGTPIITTRGMGEKQVVKIVSWINELTELAIENKDLPFENFEEKIENSELVKDIRNKVIELCEEFPLE